MNEPEMRDELRSQRSLLSGIEPTNKPYQPHIQRVADAEQSLHRNRPAGFDLLPMTGRETERDHIFLTEVPALPYVADPKPQIPEECGFIDHAPVCRGTRAETPRAD